MKFNKKIVSLLAVPVIVGGIGIVTLNAVATHAESKPSVSTHQDVAEPGDKPDVDVEDNNVTTDTETND
jgi:hypothetical protein